MQLELVVMQRNCLSFQRYENLEAARQLVGDGMGSYGPRLQMSVAVMPRNLLNFATC